MAIVHTYDVNSEITVATQHSVSKYLKTFHHLSVYPVHINIFGSYLFTFNSACVIKFSFLSQSGDMCGNHVTYSSVCAKR